MVDFFVLGYIKPSKFCNKEPHTSKCMNEQDDDDKKTYQAADRVTQLILRQHFDYMLERSEDLSHMHAASKSIANEVHFQCE